MNLTFKEMFDPLPYSGENSQHCQGYDTEFLFYTLPNCAYYRCLSPDCPHHTDPKIDPYSGIFSILVDEKGGVN